MNRVAACLVALATVGCSPDTVDEAALDCGPLARAACDHHAENARGYLKDRYPDRSVRRIEFTDASGAYLLTFTDGTQASVTP